MDDKKFNYSYFSPTEKEKEEIKSIREEYLPKEKGNEKLNRLIQLDKKVKNIPTIISLTVGIIGTLLFGFGMSLVLHWERFLLGVPISLLGCLIMFFAYPLHNYLYKKLKGKYSSEIISLSNDLLGEKEEI